jgi:hypothetical protein
MRLVLVVPILLTVALISGTPAHAQSDDRKSYIGITIGPAIPIGAFADLSTTHPRAGRAQLGYCDTFLNFGRRSGKHWGVAASVGYDEHNIQDLQKDDWWQVAAIGGGPMYTKDIARKTVLDFKAKAMFITTTRIIDSYEYNRGVGLGVDLRATLRYNVHRRWALLAESGVIASNQTFDDGSATDLRVFVTGLGIAYRPSW